MSADPTRPSQERASNTCHAYLLVHRFWWLDVPGTIHIHIAQRIAIDAHLTGINALRNALLPVATAFALACVGFGFTRPGFTAGSSLSVDRSLQGSVAGRVTAVNGAAFVLGPSIGVGLYQIWQPLPYFTSSAMLALLIFYARSRLEPPAPEPPVSSEQR